MGAPGRARAGAQAGAAGVDRAMQRRGIGASLVMDASARTYAVSRHAAVAALMADALDAAAVGWYRKLRFQPAPADETGLFVALGTTEALMEQHERGR